MPTFDVNIIKDTLQSEIQNFFDTNYPDEQVVVYRHPYFNGAVFPCINLATEDMYQEKIGIGGIKEKQLRIHIWLWVKIYDPQEAEELLNELGMSLLEFVESRSLRKRDGIWDELDIEPTEERVEFGVVEDPENFLQGMRIPIYVKRKVIIDD
jgi:hypothetical protein